MRSLSAAALFAFFLAGCSAPAANTTTEKQPEVHEGFLYFSSPSSYSIRRLRVR